MLRYANRWSHLDAGYRLLLSSRPNAAASSPARRRTLAIERLENRAMLAGDVCASAGVCESDPPGVEIPALVPQVALRLELANPDGSPLANLSAGQDFTLRVLAEDLRSDPRGVFAAYLDIAWDADKAVVTGPLSYGSEYFNGPREATSVATPGFIDEAGAFSGFEELGAGPHEVFSIPMRATSDGELVFAADQAEALINRVLVYDDPGNQPVIAEQEVQYGQVAITVTGVIAGPDLSVVNLVSEPAAVAEVVAEPVAVTELAAASTNTAAASAEPSENGAAQAAATSPELASVPAAVVAAKPAAAADSSTQASAAGVIVANLLKATGLDFATSATSDADSSDAEDGTEGTALVERPLDLLGPI